ncbi:MAG: hypothetical protein KDD69_04660 [Bdellovibrionales bacterium]|nr:hypothetical protein [Bdellovibrionales bacterium]
MNTTPSTGPDAVRELLHSLRNRLAAIDSASRCIDRRFRDEGGLRESDRIFVEALKTNCEGAVSDTDELSDVLRKLME